MGKIGNILIWWSGGDDSRIIEGGVRPNGSQRYDEWVCDKCTKRNFMFKAECRRCKALPNEAQRNEGAGGKGREDTPPWTLRPGKTVAVEEEVAALQDNEILQAAAAAKSDAQQRKTKSSHDSEEDKNSIARQTETRRMPCQSAKIENLLKQVPHEQKMKQLEAAREQAKTKQAEVTAAKEKARIAIKELTKAEEACEQAEKKARMMQAIVEGGANTPLQCSRAHHMDGFFSKLRTAREEMPENETQHLEQMEKQLMEAIKKPEEIEAKRQPDAMEDGIGSALWLTSERDTARRAGEPSRKTVP